MSSFVHTESPEQILDRARAGSFAAVPAVARATANLGAELRILTGLKEGRLHWDGPYPELSRGPGEEADEAARDDAILLAEQTAGEAAVIVTQALADAEAWERAV